MTIDNEAVVAEQLHGEMDNLIIGSMQLGHEVLDGNDVATGYSLKLILALVEETHHKLKNLKLTSLIDLRPAKRALLRGLPVLICVLGICIFA